jgi:hypothetical protein
VVGNHDFEVADVAGRRFPIARRQIDIIRDHYPTASSEHEIPAVEIGSRHYLFVHGHQFDTTFRRIRAWTLISYFRNGAEAFRSYSWVIVTLAIVWSLLIIFGFLRDWTPVFVLLILGALPRLFISIARPVYNRCFRTRYRPEKAVRGFVAWWKSLTRGRRLPRGPFVVVYGHTHMADILRGHEISESTGHVVEGDLTLINIPAWVWDTNEKYKPVFNDAALYIDSDGYKLIGWNWNESRPFYIPDEVVRLRAAGGKLDDAMAEELKNMNWPSKLLEKWAKPLPSGLRLGSTTKEVSP